MKNESKIEFLTEVYTSLEAFYSNTVSYKGIRNLVEGSDKWILSDDEINSVLKVLEVLKDCGAKDPIGIK